MGIRYAITSLATFGATVSGVTNSYDLQQIPDKVTRVQLPCLLIVPEVGIEQGFRTLSFSGNAPEQTFEITQLLLYAEADVLEVKRALPGLLTLLDNYNAAAKANPQIDTQAGPPYNRTIMEYGVEIGITEWGDVKYHSIAFKHKLVIYL